MKFERRKNTNELHVEHGHPLEASMKATGEAMNLKLTGTFNMCEDCTLDKEKKAGESTFLVERSTIKNKMFFIDISSPSTVSIGGEKHWLW